LIDHAADGTGLGTTSVVAKLVALQLEGSGGEVLDEVVRRWVVSWVREAMGEL